MPLLTTHSWRIRRGLSSASVVLGLTCLPALAMPITTQGSGPYYRLVLPSQVHASSKHTDLRDLQVRNAAVLPVPFAWISGELQASDITSTKAAIYPVPQTENAESSSASRLGLQLAPDGSIRLAAPSKGTGHPAMQWIVDTHKIKDAMVQLRLELAPSAAGLFTVKVESSNDLAQWRSVSAQAQIARLKTAGSQIERLELELPSVRAKYLRISTESGSQSLPLVGVKVDSVRRAEAIPPLEWSDAITPTRCELSFCDYILPRNVPLSSVRVALSQSNTLSPVSIIGLRPVGSAATASRHRHTNPLRLLRHKNSGASQPSNTASESQTLLASTVLYRLNAASGKTTGELLSPDIALDGDTFTALRISSASTIQLLGTPAPTIRAGSYPRSLVFLAQGTAPFHLVWLEPISKNFALPLETLIPNYKRGMAVEADAASVVMPPTTAAKAQVQPSPVAATPPVADKKPWLWAMLGLALVLLSGMAYSLFRSFKTKEASESTPNSTK